MWEAILKYISFIKKSGFFEKIRRIPELSRETGGGCVLWKERELVQSILDESKQESKVASYS